ncbi:MAG TPA: peptidoglycan-binding domain-containing protein [Gemmatimonadaceae bacterium]|nr:peptidoglycan-binding domain-containing protein [Gemmatimonadaceae bacterium]
MRTFAITLLVLAAPCMLAAQQDTSRTYRRDTTRARNRTERVSRGSIGRRMGAPNMGLTGDQVRQLQTALKQDDCDPGAVDGVLGPHTRRAMACARRKNDVNGSNVNDLLRSLNLDFTVQDSTGMGGVMRRGGRGMGATNPDTTLRNDTSAVRARRGRANRGMGRMRGDTTMRTRRDTLSRPRRRPRPDTSLHKP